jgi:hypothetical protein
MKQRIFIGSSKEGLNVAEYIKANLKSDFECSIWTDDIFKYNDSFFDTLIREASLFDYGILIATKDDFTIVRDKSFDTPRDNVVFEFGLFLGSMGTSRAFLIQEKGSKLPSDLLGITIPSFEIKGNLDENEELQNFIRRITETIKENSELGTLSLLPSTALAIGYFNNFLQPLSEKLYTSDNLEIDGVSCAEFEIKIVLPHNLDSDIKKYAQVFFKKHNLNQTSIKTNSRNFPVYIVFNKEEGERVVIYDIPTTIDGIDKAIEILLQKGHIGKTSQQKLLEERELRNFETTLSHLIANDAYARELIKIIKE